MTTDPSENLIYDEVTKSGVLLGSAFAHVNDSLMWTDKGYYFKSMFRLRDQDGLPLVIQFDLLQRKATELNTRLNPCIKQFVTDAVMAGWNRETAVSQLEEAFVETWGPRDGQKRFAEAMDNGLWFYPNGIEK